MNPVITRFSTALVRVCNFNLNIYFTEYSHLIYKINEGYFEPVSVFNE